MKNLLIFIIVFFTSLSSFFIAKNINTFMSEYNKNKIIKDYAITLRSCFDLENKNKRRIHESFDLIEYCLKEFGID